MKTVDLYFNQTQMVKDFKLRTRLSILVEDASPDQLKSLGFIVAHKQWSQDDIERDLGSNAIEYLLDCIENADHEKLIEIKSTLETQGIPV